MASRKKTGEVEPKKPPSKKPVFARQSGAIPYRIGSDGLEVLLITSRETQRWVIPKGNIGKGMSLRESAAREAFEEAGIQGVMNDTPLGFYTYQKVMKNRSERPTVVEVYALRLTDQAKKWPEKAERESAWMTSQSAARLVQEPGLAILILRLADIYASSDTLP